MKIPLARLDDIKESEIKEINFFDRSVLLTRVEGVYNAFVNVCTHVGGPLLLAGGGLRCQWHQAFFDLKSGRRLEGPGPFPLIRLPVRIEDGQLVYVYGK